MIRDLIIFDVFSLCQMGLENAEQLLEKWESVSCTLHSLLLENTKSEFSQLSRISYGLDQDDEIKLKDFTAVRGTFETEPIIKNLMQEKDRINARVDDFKKLLKRFF